MNDIQDFPNEEAFIQWLFNGRCILCFKKAECIHEIIPRSSGKESMHWKNRIPLCNECHNMGENSVHHRGISKEVIQELQKARIDFLIRLGRKNHV